MEQKLDEQERAFGALYANGLRLLQRFGKEDCFGKGDFWLLDDNYGWRQQKLYVNNLSMLEPKIIYALQKLLDEFPDWEWVVAVDVGPVQNWPDMGLVVRKNEIIDGLQRRYFPREFRKVRYVGSRVAGLGN